MFYLGLDLEMLEEEEKPKLKEAPEDDPDITADVPYESPSAHSERSPTAR